MPFLETNDSYLDEYGECICDTDENMLESTNSVSTRSLARTERKRQRAFLKRHTTLGIDSHTKRRKRKHRKRQLNFATDAPQKLTSRLISEIKSNRRIKRNTPSIQSNLTNIEVQEISGQSEVTKVLKEIAEEEIDEVDIIMEDINDEIKDLQQSITPNLNKNDKDLTAAENFNATANEKASLPFGEKIKV